MRQWLEEQICVSERDMDNALLAVGHARGCIEMARKLLADYDLSEAPAEPVEPKE